MQYTLCIMVSIQLFWSLFAFMNTIESNLSQFLAQWQVYNVTAQSL